MTSLFIIISVWCPAAKMLTSWSRLKERSSTNCSYRRNTAIVEEPQQAAGGEVAAGVEAGAVGSDRRWRCKRRRSSERAFLGIARGRGGVGDNSSL